ncbi:LIC_12616 family protein [Fusobacterium massiliense]|uniref:phage neck terminator protein n=1 Tax=Fusobacterium massiliense TaxID=1852365 RepID=UPI0028D18153|nr:hypothetical protein [Fusobacterium massiliense]
MNNIDLEILFLDKIKELNNKFQVIPFEHLSKVNGQLKLPRVLARTISNNVIHRYTNDREDTEKYGVFKQTNINKHIISFSFTLSKKDSFIDVAIVRDYFTNIEAINWWIKLNDLNLVIEEVGEIKDITDNTASDILERYVFDLVVRSSKELETNIEIIKKVDFKIERSNK